MPNTKYSTSHHSGTKPANMHITNWNKDLDPNLEPLEQPSGQVLRSEWNWCLEEHTRLRLGLPSVRRGCISKYQGWEKTVADFRRDRGCQGEVVRASTISTVGTYRGWATSGVDVLIRRRCRDVQSKGTPHDGRREAEHGRHSARDRVANHLPHAAETRRPCRKMLRRRIFRRRVQKLVKSTNEGNESLQRHKDFENEGSSRVLDRKQTREIGCSHEGESVENENTQRSQ